MKKGFIHEKCVSILLWIIGIFIWMNIDLEMGKKMTSGLEISQIRYGNFQLYTNGTDLYQNLFDDINRSESMSIFIFILLVKMK